MARYIVFIISVLVLLSSCGCSLQQGGGEESTATAATGAKQDGPITENKGTVDSLTIEYGKNPENLKTAQNNSLKVTLYYQDKDGYLIPVTRRINKQVAVARAAIGRLIDSALNREEIEYFGLYPVLPMGTEILGINIKDRVATIDFNSKFLDYEDGKDERNVICSVVYTLTEFSTVEGVRILVNGHPKEKLEFGSDISGVLNRKNILINTEGINLKEDFDKSDIYVFKTLKDSHTFILPVSREHSIIEENKRPGRIIELLSGWVNDETLYSEFPSNVKLVGCRIEEGLLTLDFGKEILNYGGRLKEDRIVDQLLYSMKQIEQVEGIKILINGVSAVLPEGTDISGEIALPVGINAIIDT